LFGEDAGGFGGTGVDISLVFEGIGRGLVTEPFLAALLGGTCLERGNAAQREKLGEAIAGESLVTLAHCDPSAGYYPNYLTTSARPDAAGWIIDGRKIAVPFGAVADDFVVSARTAGDTGGTDGISLFLVPGAADGLVRDAYNTVDGGANADLTFTNVRVGPDALIGNEGEAFAVLVRAINRGVLALSAEALGVMSVTSDMTLQYLRDRRQFGVPIGSFQALQHRMADIVIAIEQARSAVINAASALDEDEATAGLSLSAAKYTTGRTGRHVAEEAIQMHGGNGMTWEVPVAHYPQRRTREGVGGIHNRNRYETHAARAPGQAARASGDWSTMLAPLSRAGGAGRAAARAGGRRRTRGACAGPRSGGGRAWAPIADRRPGPCGCG
jgi:alkylation response protein AidB-like acyl-CoA dehydrogenase